MNAASLVKMVMIAYNKEVKRKNMPLVANKKKKRKPVGITTQKKTQEHSEVHTQNEIKYT